MSASGFSRPLQLMQYPVELRAATREQLADHLEAFEVRDDETSEYAAWLTDCVLDGYRFAS